MPVTLTIKQVPDELAEALRQIAAQNHRSLQRELMLMLKMRARQEAGATRAFVSPAAAMSAETLHDSQPKDSLLEELDVIVAGSNWGNAPLLSRDDAHERALTREFEHLVQERQADYRK